ncbi:MAG TPA: heavy metal-associated domain-containing protein [Bacillota bacterium]|nr:heavy metal-associated domain-containing protein [Bacillota bacterium]HPF42214.1 heavy metal-associated domain-containing protein [Bacillota bacterium]HPQ61769.1 heavy metal-associated domain-containing protein [Bacillota bacterium]HRX91245.1 heavy metal-associated domain-containing protein [Candidatus Izemoplasmatales bacterium]
MKKAIIEGICCNGCARDVQHILEGIYGVTDVSVSAEDGVATFKGYVSKKVIAATLEEEGYHLVELISEE